MHEHSHDLIGSNGGPVFVVNKVQNSHCSSDCICTTKCLWDSNGSTGPDVGLSPRPLYFSGERGGERGNLVGLSDRHRPENTPVKKERTKGKKTRR